MKILAAFLVLVTSALADTVTLKNGRSIEFKVLRDAGDKCEIQTTSDQVVSVDKSEIEKVSFSKTGILTGASFTISGKGTKTVDLVASVDIKRDAPKGKWKVVPGGLFVDSDVAVPTPLQFSVAVPDEYDLRFTIQRKDGVDGFYVGLPRNQYVCLLHIDQGMGTSTTLCGKSVPGGLLEKGGKAKSILCSVRKERIKVFIDDKEYLDADAIGYVPDQLCLPERKTALYFGTYKETAVTKASFSVSRISLTYK